MAALNLQEELLCRAPRAQGREWRHKPPYIKVEWQTAFSVFLRLFMKKIVFNTKMFIWWQGISSFKFTFSKQKKTKTNLSIFCNQIRNFYQLISQIFIIWNNCKIWFLFTHEDKVSFWAILSILTVLFQLFYLIFIGQYYQ